MSDVGILHGDDPPGNWQHAGVSGSTIRFALPCGMTANGEDVADDECLELVIEEVGEGEVEVWVVAYPPEHIVRNYKSVGDVIGSGSRMVEGGEIAMDWMLENPGGGGE